MLVSPNSVNCLTELTSPLTLAFFAFFNLTKRVQYCSAVLTFHSLWIDLVGFSTFQCTAHDLEDVGIDTTVVLVFRLIWNLWIFWLLSVLRLHTKFLFKIIWVNLLVWSIVFYLILLELLLLFLLGLFMFGQRSFLACFRSRLLDLFWN